MFKRLIVFCALALGSLAGVAQADCNAHAERPWSTARIVVDSLGPDCGHAVLVLTVRDKVGNVLWDSAHRTVDLMTFQEAPKFNAKTIAKELRNWVSVDDKMKDASKLADWPASVTEGVLPEKAEFPFRVAEGLDREGYLAMRKAKLPVVCFVTGMESQTCLVLNKDAVTEIGTQSFPG